MTNAELIDKVAQQISKSADVSKKATGEIIDIAVAEVAKAIKKEKRFSYPGFGTFNVKTRKARKGRNPQTGQVISIKASKTVAFKPAPELKKKL
jgi:DNA-binding protein HU-beta